MNLSIVWNNDPIFLELGSFQLRHYGLCWAIGIAAGWLVLKSIYKKEKLSEDLLGSLFLYIMFGVIIGARLGHCLFYDPSYYLSHPLEMLLPISKDALGNYHLTGYAGLASHGGAIGIVISILLYSKKKKVDLWDILDKLALVAPLTGFFIRVGNFFNSEIIGQPTGAPWGIVFKKIDNIARHPAQLYEAFIYLIIFLVLYRFYFKIKDKYQSGVIFGISIFFIFLSRFLIEYFKEVQEPFEVYMRETFFIDMGQLLSFPFIIAGLIIIFNRTHSKINKS